MYLDNVSGCLQDFSVGFKFKIKPGIDKIRKKKKSFVQEQFSLFKRKKNVNLIHSAR